MSRLYIVIVLVIGCRRRFGSYNRFSAITHGILEDRCKADLNNSEKMLSALSLLGTLHWSSLEAADCRAHVSRRQ